MEALALIGSFPFLVWVGSIIWVWADAATLMKGLSIEQRREVSGWSPKPGDWVFWCIIIWIVAFPVYLGKRGGYIAAQQRRLQEPPGVSL